MFSAMQRSWWSLRWAQKNYLLYTNVLPTLYTKRIQNRLHTKRIQMFYLYNTYLYLQAMTRRRAKWQGWRRCPGSRGSRRSLSQGQGSPHSQRHMGHRALWLQTGSWKGTRGRRFDKRASNFPCRYAFVLPGSSCRRCQCPLRSGSARTAARSAHTGRTGPETPRSRYEILQGMFMISFLGTYYLSIS